MKRSDDVPGEMTRHEMDDAAAERLLRGSAAAGQEPLGLLLSQLRAMGTVAPEPSAALAAMLRDGIPPAAAVAPPVLEAARRRRRVAAVAGMSLAVKLLAGTGVAVAAVGTAAGAGVLPEPVRDGVSSVVRTLTPFDPDGGEQAPRPAGPAPVQPARPTLPTAAPVPAPAAPGVDRRPASPQAEQRPQQSPQQRAGRPSRPAQPEAPPRGAGSPGERPGPATPAEAGPRRADLPRNPAADARAAGSPRR